MNIGATIDHFILLHSCGQDHFFQVYNGQRMELLCSSDLDCLPSPTFTINDQSNFQHPALEVSLSSYFILGVGDEKSCVPAKSLQVYFPL